MQKLQQSLYLSNVPYHITDRPMLSMPSSWMLSHEPPVILDISKYNSHYAKTWRFSYLLRMCNKKPRISQRANLLVFTCTSSFERRTESMAQERQHRIRYKAGFFSYFLSAMF